MVPVLRIVYKPPLLQQTLDTSMTPHHPNPEPSGVLRFRRYIEPHEQAYAFDAPDGWNVAAPLIRLSSTITRMWKVVTSPDQQVYVVSGLPPQYLFMEPNQMTMMMGLREGGTTDGVTYVARYQDARTFAGHNVQAFTHGCRNLSITGERARPDEAQRLEHKARREGDWVNGAQIDAAELAFTCEGPYGPAAGGFIAATIRIAMPGVTTWVGEVRGFIAPPDRANEAYRVMEHITLTHQTNPHWKARQRQAHQAKMQASQQAHQQRMAQNQAMFNAHQQRMAQNQAAFDATQRSFADERAAFDAGVQSWQQQQRVQGQLNDQFTGYLRDETRVWDTSTGQSYDVPVGSDHYYIDDTGSTILGTPDYMDNPDPVRFNRMYEGYDFDDNTPK